MSKKELHDVLPASEINAGRVEVHGLRIAKSLYDFVNHEVIPGTGVSPDMFWKGASELLQELTPRNTSLLEKRGELQNKIDAWYQKEGTEARLPEKAEEFLRSIGYLTEEKEDFKVSTTHLDQEVSTMAGPQLVVPIMNARYALNAANARWGSLYDAFYGSDVIASEGSQTHEYDPNRGQKVINRVRILLDEFLPLVDMSHKDVTVYRLDHEGLIVQGRENRVSRLKNPDLFQGYQGEEANPEQLLFEHHGLRLIIFIDRDHQVGKHDRAGICDVCLESALSVIMDFEDSIAAIDVNDKVLAYRNWLGLIKGDLIARVQRGGKAFERRLQSDDIFKAPDQKSFTVPGRSLMLVRNVGHLMRTSMILLPNGEEVYEGQVDALVTSLINLHDRKVKRNSKHGSIYIVKPKMHGPEEVAFANTLFSRVEDILQLPRDTIKVGLMDEEKRTTLNLKECIRAIQSRIFFINTGFLDRTGDEIHTMMEAGPVTRKSKIKECAWIKAYEGWNVSVGLACGMSQKGQIGKGMWAMPDLMAKMLKEKSQQLLAGATTAWVPSPTAATLHAIHYHCVAVFEVHKALQQQDAPAFHDLLQIPVSTHTWSKKEIQEELDNNAQSILGYVVRWVEDGIGCSKVPDINNVALMEDRATLRISSQHISNWLHHGVCTVEEVYASLKRMAAVVDQQNAEDPNYANMAGDLTKSRSFATACDLVLKGRDQPSGYTEPILHAHRLFVKRSG